MRPGIAGRASDLASRCGDYVIVTAALVLTLIVFMGLQSVGLRNVAPRARAALVGFVTDTGIISLTPRSQGEQPTFDKEMSMTPAELIDRWNPLIAVASRRFGIPKAWIRAVRREESGGRTVLPDGRPITSIAGAMGVMQVMLGTYEEMRKQFHLGADPFNPRDNIIAGTGYLRWLYRKYGFPDMFAAYNDGPGMLEAHRDAGQPLPEETRDYLFDITRMLSKDHRRVATMLAELGPRDRRLHRRISVTFRG